MGVQLSIRNAEPADAEEIQTISRASWHKAYDDILGEETVDNVIDEWYEIDGLRTSIEETIFYVGERDGELVGFANAGQNPVYEEGTFELFRIYVLPEYWNRGIGSRLLESVIADVKSEEGNELRLSVLMENEAGVGFYELHDFERVETEKIEFDGDTYEEYRYVKPLR
ncbi:GNAT family N-acetyltransferase [Natrinema soli]|uniref:GNAT family N-acetyltransferase n=1 Tax=Natrinema soli TaxID=1930624 RepID=A0ABD5SJ51_9EURY|nr:GNAT family N-acetyltransferase [Natrinema soli]